VVHHVMRPVGLGGELTVRKTLHSRRAKLRTPTPT
jgi:hypothetical protein